MKIFFIGERRFEENMKLNNQIVEILEHANYKVDKSLLEKKHEEDAANFEKAYKRNLTSIKNCDVIVAEVSGISSGIGFLLATALNQKKPVLALFNKSFGQKAPLTLKGAGSKLFHYAEYDEKDLKSILLGSLDHMRQILDSKFILIIPSEIDRYLEWASDYKRMHKAQLVREAIENFMSRDREWKEFTSEE